MDVGSSDSWRGADIGARAASPQPEAASTGDVGAVRIHAFDWLRAAAVVGVVVYHSLLPFGLRDWHVNNAEKSALLTAGLLLFETFGMGLLFVLAGASARFALRTRSDRSFLSERIARLLVPFVVFTLLLTPPTMYLAAVNHESTTDSFPAFLAAWPAGAVDWMLQTGLSPRLFAIGFHLWFLGFLFAFSVLGLAAFWLLETAPGRAFVDALARAMRWPGSTLLFAMPIALPPLVLLAPAPDQFEWWQFGWYGAYFLVGYVLFLDERFGAAVRRDLPAAVVVAILASAGLVAADFGGWVAAHEDAPFVYDLTYALMVGIYVLAGWAWTLALLGLGLRVRVLQRPLPRAVGVAVLPIYVLHHPIVIAVSFVVVGLSLELIPKATIIVLVGLALTVGVVAVALRVPVARSALGVRRSSPGTQASPRLPAGTAPGDEGGGVPTGSKASAPSSPAGRGR